MRTARVIRNRRGVANCIYSDTAIPVKGRHSPKWVVCCHTVRMSVVTQVADPLTLMDARSFLDGVSERQRARFITEAGRLMNCRIGKSRKVHPVIEVEWLGGVRLLVPACGIGLRPDAWLTVMHETTEAADGPHGCMRYLCKAMASTNHRAAPPTGAAAQRLHQPPDRVQGQLPLFLSA
jgi:hypothetical protein